jgi:type IV secretion system protein VirB6
MNGGWHVWAIVWGAVVTPLQGSIANITGAVLDWTLPYIKTFTVLGILAMIYVAMYSAGGEDRIWNLIRTVFCIALALWIISDHTLYTNIVMSVGDVAPTKLGNAIAGANGGGPLGADSFDKLTDTALAVGAEVFKMIGWSPRGIVLGFGCLAYWGLVILASAFLFLVYLSAHVIMLLMVALGGIFVAMAPFPYTRRFFDGWVSALGSSIAVKVLAVLLIALLVRATGPIIQQLPVGKSGNVIQALEGLGGIGAIIYIFGRIAKDQLPAIATAIFGGIYHQVGAYHNLIYGTATKAASGAAGAATGGASTAAGGLSEAAQTVSPMSAIRPAGKAI